jgi:uncharacterized low-complexity protein
MRVFTRLFNTVIRRKSGRRCGIEESGQPFARHQSHFARITVEYFPWLRGLARRSIFKSTREERMKRLNKLQTLSALTALLGTGVAIQAAAATPQFVLRPLLSGYALAGDAPTADEGRCGEGKCGMQMMDTDKNGKVTFEESKAGKFSEKQFKAWDANNDGTLEKSELDAMHRVKGKEGYCS